jgi:hypothetical protein
MISETEATVLGLYISELPPHANLQDYSLAQDIVEDLIERSQTDTDSTNWLRFFDEVGTNSGTEIKFDLDTFIKEIVNTLSDNEWLLAEPEYDQVSDGIYSITLMMRQRGEVKIQIFSSTEGLQEGDFSFREKKIGGFTITPSANVVNDESIYSWQEIVEDGFLTELRRRLERVLGPDLIKLCSSSTPALQKEPERVEDSIEFYAGLFDMYPEESPSDIEKAKIFNYIGQENIRNFIKEPDGWIVDCQCSQQPDTRHFHYFIDGSPTNTEQSNNIHKIKNRVRKKVKQYSTWREEKQNIEPATRTIGAVLAIAGVVQAFPLAAMISYFNIDTSTDVFYYMLAAAIFMYIVVAISLLMYMMAPAIRFNHLSWERRSVLERLLDTFHPSRP